MKVLLFGKASKNIEELIKNLGFEIVTSNPEAVISYGGDGTLLSAEREHPGIPKLPLRNNQFCNKCSQHEDEIMLKKLLSNNLQLKSYKKLETTLLYEQVPSFGSKTFYALNDFVIRNSDPTHSIRFNVNDKYFIGDGIVVATAFGSTGYFKSVTGQSFEEGFGLAFNNTTEKVPPVFLNDEDSVTFNLKRGKATLSFDNSPNIFNIDEGSELVFKLSDKIAKIYEAESLRCPTCQIIRA